VLLVVLEGVLLLPGGPAHGMKWPRFELGQPFFCFFFVGGAAAGRPCPRDGAALLWTRSTFWGSCANARETQRV